MQLFGGINPALSSVRRVLKWWRHYKTRSVAAHNVVDKVLMINWIDQALVHTRTKSGLNNKLKSNLRKASCRMCTKLVEGSKRSYWVGRCSTNYTTKKRGWIIAFNLIEVCQRSETPYFRQRKSSKTNKWWPLDHFKTQICLPWAVQSKALLPI